MEKTVKINAYSAPAKSDTALELEHKQAQIAEERNKALELLKNITLLRENLKQEQARSAELENTINKLAGLEENRFAKFNAQFEEEKKKSLEHMHTIEQLRASLQQEQAKTAELTGRSSELAAKAQEIAALETKVAVLETKIKDLSGVISKISSIAEAAKVANGN